MPSAPLQSILLAEDDDDIREIASLSLEAIGGFTVTTCVNGMKVIEALENFHPNLVILDVMMPGMDGPSVLAKMKEMPDTRDIPVIFMTAKVMKEEIQRFKDMGAMAVIHKPFDPETLPAQILKIWEHGHG